MKSKIKTLEIIVLTVVLALAMIACDIFGDQKKEVDTSQYYLNPPTGLAATIMTHNNNNNDTLHLTWNAVSGAGHYEISARTNLDSADTRLSLSTYTTVTRYEHSFYSWYWGYYSRPQEVTTLYYYVKAHPSKSGYIASDWSNPVSVNIK
jgi:hypothetical protein